MKKHSGKPWAIQRGQASLFQGRSRGATFGLQVETLEQRCLLTGLAESLGIGQTVAADDDYRTDEDTVLFGNLVTDDTGGGADTPDRPSTPLIVTAINEEPFPPAETIALSSGARLTVAADGEIRFDPTASTELAAMTTGDVATETFSYTVSPGFSDLIVFGDSLSDPGNLYRLTGQQFPPPPYFQGHASNGPVWVEYLATHLGLESHPAYTASSPAGNNFAVFGATTANDNLYDERLGVPDPPGLPGLSDQVQSYLARLEGRPADPNALYVVWAGPNDFFAAQQQLQDPSQAPMVIGAAVNNIATAVGSLYAQGAKYFLVPNLVDLGKTPWGITEGIGTQLRMLVQGFNGALAGAMSQLGSFGAQIVYFDVFAALDNMLTNPSAYGFTNVTQPSIGLPDATGYVYWDTVHPTTKTHAGLAEAAFATLLTHEPMVHSDSAAVTITVDGVMTTPLATISGPAVGVRGEPLKFILTAQDPAPADAASAFTYRIDWNGDGSAVESVSGPASGIEVLHQYSVAGLRKARATVTDRDGDTGAAVQTAVDVRAVALIDGELRVGGTYGGDAILVSEDLWGGVLVRINGLRYGSYTLAPTGRVVVFGQSGNDWINAAGLMKAITIDGGRGNDRIIGGRGNDVLRGGEGNDRLWGGRGNDQVFGGEGNDWLSGDAGNDLLDGESGIDRLFGGRGKDHLLGGRGNDRLYGDGDDDELDGGEGLDWLFGGSGKDILLNGERNRA